jgi:hypothetical protein
MRTRNLIRRDHRGQHLAETLYIRTHSGVVMLAGVHAHERVRRESAISAALFRRTHRQRQIDDATAEVARLAQEDAIGEDWTTRADLRLAHRDLADLLALPPVHVPKPLPAVSVFTPPLVRDRRGINRLASAPAGTHSERHTHADDRAMWRWHAQAEHRGKSKRTCDQLAHFTRAVWSAMPANVTATVKHVPSRQGYDVIFHAVAYGQHARKRVFVSERLWQHGVVFGRLEAARADAMLGVRS